MPSMLTAWSSVIRTLLICAQGLNPALAYSWTGMVSQVSLRDAVLVHVRLHDLGEEMRKTKTFPSRSPG